MELEFNFQNSIHRIQLSGSKGLRLGVFPKLDNKIRNRNLRVSRLFGNWSQEAVIGKRGNVKGKEWKLIKGVVLSSLPLWAAQNQFCCEFWETVHNIAQSYPTRGVWKLGYLYSKCHPSFSEFQEYDSPGLSGYVIEGHLEVTRMYWNSKSWWNLGGTLAVSTIILFYKWLFLVLRKYTKDIYL